jgi:hypothetical protein
MRTSANVLRLWLRWRSAGERSRLGSSARTTAEAPALSRRRAGDLWTGALLALVVAAAFCLVYGQTRIAHWTKPVQYRGDALFLLAYLKAAAEGQVVPGAAITVPAMNAPFGADWNDYPRPLKVAFFLTGLLARGVGLPAAANLMLLGTHLLAALSLYGVARHLRARREWAFAAGLAFGTSPYLLWRSFEHVDLALCWHLPLCVLVLGWCFRRAGLPLRSGRFVVAALVAAVTGLHNPYYGFLFGQLLLLTALAQAVRPQKARHALAPLALLLVMAGAAVLDNLGIFLYQLQEGPSAAAMVRPYGNVERFALKPIDLLLPAPAHGLGGWGTWVSVYWGGRLYRGEGGAAYLGLIGIAGLAWLTLASVRPVLRGERARLPAAAAAAAWTQAFSMVGGVNGLLGVFELRWLRGTNRFSVFLLTLGLLYLATRMSRLALPRWGRLAGAASLGALALADHLHGGAQVVAHERVQFESDRLFVAGLEAVLPEGAMLFQYPPIDFPEGRPVGRTGEYDHLRPYLFSTRLRWSFGADKGRPREEWQRRAAELPPAQLANRLEAGGFSGIVVHRGAFPDQGAGFVAALSEGRAFTPAQTWGDWLFVPLRPSASPDPRALLDTPAAPRPGR